MKLYSREHSVSNLVSRLFSFSKMAVTGRKTVRDKKGVKACFASHFRFVEFDANEENLLFNFLVLGYVYWNLTIRQ